ncbi:MAG: DHHA1 domain-containing protein, partial [Flavobacteriia bacterium]
IEIDTDNKDRRKLDQLITSEALEILESDPLAHERRSTVVFKSDWHKGVVGIVASRLIEKHFKPTIVLTESNGKATGSARTVNDFDIYSALVKCEHLLEQFGGHTHAAGMTLALENVEAFIEEFERVVNESIAVADRTPEQAVDLELNFNEIFTPGENRMKVPRLKRILEQFEPHGPGNMKPVFLSTNVFSTDMRILKEDHLKISIVQPPCDLVLEGIGFNLAEKSNAVASGIPFDIVYTLESNKWKDREIVQLNLKDLRES